jgi:hypothetical protein
MYWAKLTRHDGKMIYVNLDSVRIMEPVGPVGRSTRLYFNDKDAMEVKESPNQIFDLNPSQIFVVNKEPD